MGSWTDVEITGVLSGLLTGAVAAFLSMDDKHPLGRRDKIVRFGGSLLVGLLAGLLAVWLTEPLEGCSIIKAKDSDFYLVWGTDGVMVRTVAMCGVLGTILGALAEGVRVHRTSAGGRSDTSHRLEAGDTRSPITGETGPGCRGVNAASSGPERREGSGEVWSTVLAGALGGFLGGALLIGMPATFIVTTIRAMRGLP